MKVNEAEIQSKIKQKNLEFAGKTFCPLINGLCQDNCFCFQESTSSKAEEGMFHIYNASCGNPMLSNYYVIEIMEKLDDIRMRLAI